MKSAIPIPAIVLAALLLAATAHAQNALPPAQDLGELEQLVVTRLGADIGQPGGPMMPIDRRMRLAACPTGIEIDPPTIGAVTVRCTTAGWRLRVPLTRPVAVAGAATSSTIPAQPAKADIRRGDPVELVAQGKAFQVSIDGTAMEDAFIGGRVRVSTGGRGQTLFAEVVDVGKVRLVGFK
jgi:flagella basal body P-ring formation protein FlgA